MRPAVLTRLTTGMMARFQPGLPLALVHASAGHSFVSTWPTAVAVFEGTPLKDVVRQANRYSRVKIVLSERKVGQRRFYGTVRLNDTRRLARILARGLSLRLDEQQDWLLLSSQ